MNQKKLTIAIPTYNRASLLKEQLKRISEAIQGFENDCEVIISNNCSTDNTDEAIKKVQEESLFDDLITYTQSENIGALRNISYCIKVATGRHVWIVSDDDILNKDAIQKVVNSISQSPDLGLMVLNYSTLQPEGDKVIKKLEYILDEDDLDETGKDFFEKYLEKSWGGLVFTTALVYRTELARAAVDSWLANVDNSMFQLYITSFCAMNSPALMTRDAFLIWVARENFVFKDKKLFIKHHFIDVPVVFLKLIEMGYSQSLCRKMILDRFVSSGGLNCSLRLLAARPFFTLHLLIKHAGIMKQIFRITLIESENT